MGGGGSVWRWEYISRGGSGAEQTPQLLASLSSEMFDHHAKPNLAATELIWNISPPMSTTSTHSIISTPVLSLQSPSASPSHSFALLLHPSTQGLTQGLSFSSLVATTSFPLTFANANSPFSHPAQILPTTKIIVSPHSATSFPPALHCPSVNTLERGGNPSLMPSSIPPAPCKSQQSFLQLFLLPQHLQNPLAG